MELALKQPAVGQIGCALFGTPNGREVVAQSGISVAHQDDWVAQAAQAIEFDVATDTLVMQRISLASATVFWFGMMRKASEIDFNRGGYVGFGVWAVNHRLDGEKLFRTLTLAAAQVRNVSVSNGKFHTSIRSIAAKFASDADSYDAMLASAKALSRSASTGEPFQRPMVLDMRGCSDVWYAQIIDLFQSDSGEYTGEALALARSDAVVESAKHLNLWPVVNPIDWLTSPNRTRVQGLHSQLHNTAAELKLRDSEHNELSRQLSAANEKVQNLATIRQQLHDAEMVAQQERLAALQARQERDNLQHRAKEKFETLGQRTRDAERSASESATELEQLRGELQALKTTRLPAIHGQRLIVNAPHEMENLKLQLQNKSYQCDDLETKNSQLSSENQKLKDHLDGLAERKPPDSADNTGLEIKAAELALWHWVAMGVGWFVALVFAILLLSGSGGNSDIKTRERQFEEERAQHSSEIDELNKEYRKLGNLLTESTQSEKIAIKERDDLKAQLQAVYAKKQNKQTPPIQDSESQFNQRDSQNSRPAATQTQRKIDSAPSTKTKNRIIPRDPPTYE